jgi:TP901 family phage tail tape measure protein
MAGRFSVDAVFRAIDQMTGPIARMQARVEDFTKRTDKGFKQINAAADKWLGGLARASKVVAASTIAVGAALAVAAKPGMDFEQAMADLGASYVLTRDEIKPLEDAALRLGKATKFSATDVVKAMEEMSKAGYSQAEALKAIDGMTYAAAASGEDLVETTLAVSSAMNAMGVPTEHAVAVADKLAMVSVKTKSSIASLSESLAKAGPAARQLGVPLDEAIKMVGLLQNVGIDAAEAGTSVSTMLTMLAKPTDQARALMKKLGVSFEDANGNMKAVPEVLSEFGKAASKSKGNMKQLAFFAELLGLRGQRAGINLQKMLVDIDPESGLSKWDALTEHVNKAGGTAKKMSDLRMATLTGDLDQLVETVKSLAIEFYSLYSKDLRKVAQSMKEWFETEGPKYMQALGEKVAWVREHFGQIVDVLARVGRVITVITLAAVATKLWAGALLILSATPAVMVLYAIVAVIAAIVAFWPEISAFFAGLWQGVVDAFNAITGWLGSLLSPVWAFLTGYWKAMLEFFVGFATIIVGVLVFVFGKIWEFLRPYAQWVYDNVLAPIGGFFSTVFGAVAEVVTAAFNKVAEVASAVFEKIKGVWGSVVDFFAGLWQGIAAKFTEVLGPVFEKIMWAVDKVRAIGRETLGTDDESTGAAPSGPQIVSPSERVAKQISESTTTNQSELLIRDETGRANFTSKNPGAGVNMSLARSGMF